ncbi:MAG: DUF1501 domain-containing protein [Chlorobi bacterium]|nr:DUF1501 domain-containing protein [Chlorobiota bacterium]
MTKLNNLSRRKFISNSSLALMGSGFLGAQLFNLKAIASPAVNDNDRNTYKAMVCLMLDGGADSFNMLIPRGNVEYNEYAASRSNLAIAQNELLAINPLNNDGKSYGLHPAMGQVQSLFNSGELSFISNIGTLVEHLTKDDFWNGNAQLPLGLLSHADQSQQWQNGRPGERTQIGWGGRISDIMTPLNSNQTIPMSVSLSGNNIFQHGLQTIEFVINENGIAGIEGYNENDGAYNQVKTAALDAMFALQNSDIYKSTYINTLNDANNAGIEFSEAINNVGEFSTLFSDNELSQKFKMIAKTIAARDDLGFEKQIFFVRFPAWDHHDNMLGNMNEMLPVLSAALAEFNAVMHELGTHSDVTTFSMSDFARTLSSNGNGTDHAWGGNVMVMGGAVNGQRRFGDFPTLALGSDIDVGGGVLIPQLSTDEYLAEIAMWFGVADADVSNIFPNLSNFYDINTGNPPIGFLNF